MMNPVSRLLALLVVFIAGVLVGLFALRAFDWTVIPQDWQDNVDDGSGIVDNDDDGTDDDAADGAVVSTSGNMIVTSPVTGQTIGVPLVVTGRARVFENALNYRLLDGDGAATVLAEGTAMADAPDVGEFGAFTISTSYTLPTAATGTLEVFDYSAKDGSVIDLVSIPVAFPTIETMMVKVYWSASGSSTDCSEVVATERQVARTTAAAYAAITELLKGPDASEKARGYTTSIPAEVTLKSITIKDGVIDLILSKEVDAGGSCRMAAIRSQIETTLKQFPTVKSIGIRTEGKTEEESLQP